MNQQKPILYLDNAATTPLHPLALESMLPYLKENYGNPSAVYSFARNARKGIEEAREQVAKAISAQPGEIFFTGSGTEANNWALRGVLEAHSRNAVNGCLHIITTAVEHHAITEVCDGLLKLGQADQQKIEITYLPVDPKGFVSPKDLKEAIRPETVLISVMWANNEIGTIQPIAPLSAIARESGILFHTDAIQAVGHIPVDVQDIPVDLLTLSAHKFGGPKGVGALYIRKGTKIMPFLYGGAQEKKRRAGTENVSGVVGMGKAIEIALAEQETEYKRVSALRDDLIKRIEETIPKVSLNGPRGGDRLPGNVNFSFDYIEGESMLLLLDMQGCCASSGSACSSSSLEPSHVLMSLGVPHEKAHGSIRFSLGRESTLEDIDRLMEMLPKIVGQLRAMSPLSEDEGI